MPATVILNEDMVVNSESDDAPFGNSASIVRLASGGFIVFWSESTANDGSGGCVQGRIYNANGVPTGPQFIVNSTTSGTQAIPDAVELPNGNILITWGDSSQLGGDNSQSAIKGQILSPAGVKLGGEFQVNTVTAGNQNFATNALLGNGNVIVVWQDLGGSDGDGAGIKAQIVDSSGAKIGSEFLVNSNTAGVQNFPNVARLANGSVIVTWVDAGGTLGDASGTSIKGQILDSSGAKVGGEFLINTETANAQNQSQVAALTNGNFVVTWQDASGVGGDADATGIKAQIFDAAGNKVGSEFLVNTTTIYSQTNPAITAMSNGSFVIAWRDAGPPTGLVQTLRGQAFSASGTRIGDEFLAHHNDGTGEISGSPMITDLGDNRFIVTATVATLSGSVPPTQVPQGLQGNIFLLLNQIGGATAGDDTLYGDATLGDSIDGLGGNDTIHGLGGIDVISGGDGNDQIFGEDGNDRLSGNDGADRIYGGNGNDIIDGGAGDDVVNGGAGMDTIDTGAGNDVIEIDNAVEAGTTFNGGADFDTLVMRPLASTPGVFGLTTTTYNLAGTVVLSGVEAAKFESGANDALVLVMLDNQRVASGLNTLIGGLGRDIFVNVVFTPGTYTMPDFTLQNWTSNILDTRSDFVALFVNPTSTAAFALNAREGLASTQSLNGALGNDILNGSSGSEFLDGGAGVNQLFGNGGDDALILRNLTPFGGVTTTLTYAGNLFDGGDGVDALDVSGMVNFQGTFVSIERIFFEPSFTATTPGQNSQAAGYLIISRAQTTGLAANLNLFGNGTLEINLAAGESFDGSAYTIDAGYTVNVILNGSTGNETIIGTVANDTIYGGDGSDNLFAISGIDSLFGGNGNDSLTVQSAASGSNVDGGAGSDTLAVLGAVSLGGLTSVEALNFSAGAALTLTGAQFNNGLAFNASVSGSGSLTINMSAADLQVSASSLVVAGGSTIALTVNGSITDEAIKGARDLVNTLNGGGGNDQIRGANLGDIINGGDGNDKIIGANGADIMTGGAGADTFRFQAVSNSGLGAAADQITDFVIGTDRLAFAAIDADLVTPGDQAFSFLGTGAFSNTGVGQIRYQDSGANLLVQIDSDGNGVADMEVVLQGLAGQVLTSGDFLL